MSYLDQINNKNFKDGNKIFVIGIAGASGCGKTYFSNTLKNKINVKGIEIISCDNYYKPYPNGKKAPSTFNWDTPNVLDLELLANHIESLKKGKTVKIPKYSFLTSQREGIEKEINGNDLNIIIVEGLFVLYDEKLRNTFDLKIFTLLDPDICLARRINRDVAERGKSYQETITQYQTHVKPAYVFYIEPTKRFADIIISTSEYTDTSKSIDIIDKYVRHELKIESKPQKLSKKTSKTKKMSKKSSKNKRK